MTRQPRSSPRRRWAGVGVGLLVLAIVAVPAFWTAMFAYAGFSGCFLECARPRPLRGAMWAAACLVLLACPVGAGLLTARRSGRPGGERRVRTDR